MKIDKIAILIKKLSLEFDKIAIPIVGSYDLTPSQYKIIKYLIHNEDNIIRQRDIEKVFSMTNPTVTGILQNLEKNGWIKRIENKDDARSKVIKLTDKALYQKDDLYKIGEKIENKLVSGLDKDEQVELKRLLNKLFDNLKEDK